MESVENVSFYFHNVSKKIFLFSPRVRKFESYVYSEVALPIMIVAFLPFIVCQDAKIAPYLTSMNKTFIVTYVLGIQYLSHTFNV